MNLMTLQHARMLVFRSKAWSFFHRNTWRTPTARSPIADIQLFVAREMVKAADWEPSYTVVIKRRIIIGDKRATFAWATVPDAKA